MGYTHTHTHEINEMAIGQHCKINALQALKVYPFHLCDAEIQFME